MVRFYSVRLDVIRVLAVLISENLGRIYGPTTPWDLHHTLYAKLAKHIIRIYTCLSIEIEALILIFLLGKNSCMAPAVSSWSHFTLPRYATTTNKTNGNYC